MGEYINFTEVVLFLLVGLLFITLNIVLLLLRYTRARYAMLSILAASLWPALMIVLSVEQIHIFEQLRADTFTLDQLLAWAIVISTALMTMIPAGVFINKVVEVSKFRHE
ncbi:hypothetical protein [Exiguobacterium algae]|uniref:hypothetical protein n=1 Tax=Exiguobacterium algae TaxID=2751250 RepID=UPI001BEC692F|nr:hypothetical protein [Exiguobacterium algae]